MYTHKCIYNTLTFIMGWSNTLKGVNTYGVHKYTLKGSTVIKYKSILYFSNIVIKHFNNNKDLFLGKILTVNGVCNSDLQ